MEKEDYRHQYYSDLLDSLVSIVKQTEKPLRMFEQVDDAVYYGYNHKHIGEGLLPSFPLNDVQMECILRVDIEVTLRALRELHPFASPHLLVALCSLVLQVGLPTYQQSYVYECITKGKPRLRTITSLREWVYTKGVFNYQWARRREWEMYTIFKQQREMDKYLSFNISI